MLGAIIGDIVGAPYEYNNVYKRNEVKPFENILFGKSCFTDDSVLTLAVARALTDNVNETDDIVLKKRVEKRLQEYYKKYSFEKKILGNTLVFDRYGKNFKKWAESDFSWNGKSTANGAAMRSASVGWLYEDLERTMAVAEITAKPTHDSKEAITAAKAVAASVYLARNKKSKEEIKKFLEEKFSYELSEDIHSGPEIKARIKKIRLDSKSYRRKQILELKFGDLIDCNAKKTVENALYAFLISKDFKDCIKTAISFGGDSDTIACIAGAVAEAYYGIPEDWRKRAMEVLEKRKCKADDILFIYQFSKEYTSV